MIDDLPYAIPIPGFSEPVSAFTHLGGAGVFLVLTWWLLRKGKGKGNRLRVIFLSVFAFTLVLLLSISSVYHILEPSTPGRSVLRRLDHAAIFSLIAGTFTPIHGILFRGPWRWSILLLIWGCTAVGTTLKTIFFDGVPPWLGVSIYVSMGWIGIVTAIKLMDRFGYTFVRYFIYGGISYTTGAVCLGMLSLSGDPMLIPGVVGRHEIFHFFVLAGAGFHWAFVFSFADFDPPIPGGK